MIIPSLQWHFMYEAFANFAALARQYHFYEPEVARMEKSLFDMSPYRKDDKGAADHT